MDSVALSPAALLRTFLPSESFPLCPVESGQGCACLPQGEAAPRRGMVASQCHQWDLMTKLLVQSQSLRTPLWFWKENPI